MSAQTSIAVPAAAMTAEQVKEALRARHPAVGQFGEPAEWTCLEEWANIDLLASSAWQGRKVVGYEVKVSRSDYRREILKPAKRQAAVEGCHEFWFAVPAGLLTPDEIAFEQPAEWTSEDFERAPCPGVPAFGKTYPAHRSRSGFDAEERREYAGYCAKGSIFVPRPSTDEDWRWHSCEFVCPTCDGKGYTAKSVAEEHAPTLWVPPDVGLIEITSRRCRVKRKAPRRKPAKPIVPADMAQLLRWASFRPDPRHVARRSPAAQGPSVTDAHLPEAGPHPASPSSNPSTETTP